MPAIRYFKISFVQVYNFFVVLNSYKQFTKYPGSTIIYHWVAKQYSKDTIERLADLIELLRPTEGTINTIYSITSEKPTEQEFLDKLKAKFPEETAAVQMQ